jgi:hypothetical protein
MHPITCQLKGMIMNEELNYGSENGLSREEHKWLSEKFIESDRNQLEQIKILQDQTKILHRINTSLQIIAVIVLISVLLVVLQLLGL